MRRSLTELGRRAGFATVVALAMPAVANSLLQTLVFLVDRVFLGRHSAESLAAMQTAGPLSWTAFSVFGAFTAGTVATVGRSVGAGDRAGATQAARASVLLGALLGALVALLLGLAPQVILGLFGDAGGPAVRAAAASYMRVLAPSFPLLLVGAACISALQAGGDTRTPLLIGLVTNALNAVANYALVFGHFGLPRLGAAGSAAATVLAGALEALLAFAALSRAPGRAKVTLRGATRWVDDLRPGARRVLAVAYGSFGERAVYHVGYLLFVSFAVSLGAHAMAANQALISLESVSFLTAEGFAVAAGSLAAQRLGARDEDGARAAGWLTAVLTAAVLSLAALAFALVPEVLIGLFRDDATIVSAGSSALRVGALAQLPMGVAIVLSQALRGAGATRLALLVSTGGALVVRLAATYLFVRVLHLGLAGVWLGSTIDWFVRCVAYVVLWRGSLWVR